jgi:hypothetical protein
MVFTLSHEDFYIVRARPYHTERISYPRSNPYTWTTWIEFYPRCKRTQENNRAFDLFRPGFGTRVKASLVQRTEDVV